MGERDHFVSLEMAAIGMEMLAEWGIEAVSARLRMLNDRLANELHGPRCRDSGDAGAGAAYPEPRLPGRHAGESRRGARREELLCRRTPRRLRISPHVYNDEEDVARFVTALPHVLR